MRFLGFCLVTLLIPQLSLANQDVQETISKIESERNVRCEFIDSRFEFCVGIIPELPKYCWYKLNYDCTGSEEFNLRLKIKDTYKLSNGDITSKVISVEYLNN